MRAMMGWPLNWFVLFIFFLFAQSTMVAFQGWTSQSSGTTVVLYEVLLADVNNGTAVGEAGRILKTSNGGANWTTVASSTTVDLFGVDFNDLDTGIAVGNNGVMRRTTDRGQTWVVLPVITSNNLRGISFADSNTGTVVGANGTVLRSTNAGASWAVLRGVSGQLFEVDFITTNTGTVVGSNGMILRTTNAGSTWVAQNSGTTSTLLGVSFSDINTGTVVGDGGIIRRTSNGGTTWTAQSSGTTRNLTSVIMVNQNIGYVVGDQGTILKTTNGGATWVAQNSGTTAALKEVSFIDANTGTVVGSNGTILRTTTGGEPPQSITLLSPTGGESYPLNSTQLISWDASGFATVKIELSTNGGSTWSEISPGVPATNMGYNWLVSGTPSTQCRIRIRNTSDSTVSSISAGNFSITPPIVSSSYGYAEGWNLISVPLIVSNFAKTSLFPSASSEAFTFDSAFGYVQRDTLRNAIGYWLKFDAAQSVPMSGYEITRETVFVKTGWNLIGSLTNKIPTSNVTSQPPGLVSSAYYGFNLSYVETDTLRPGKGYWIKVDGPGKLILSSAAPPQPAGEQIGNSAGDFLGELVVRDAQGRMQTILYGSGNDGDDRSYEMPPTPPEGSFDVRLAGGKRAILTRPGIIHSEALRISSVAYPLTLEWASRGQSGTLIVNGREISLYQSGNITIQNEASIALRIGGESSVPMEFALDQNFPNPFNPSTSIRYHLPGDSHITLKVFDALGQEVKTLVNGFHKAGTMSVTWDGTGNRGETLASGMYFVRLVSGDKSDSKKMILMK